MISSNCKRAKLTFFLILALSAAGCSQTSSENVTTQGVHADIRVIAEGNGATVVKVQLEVGSGGPARTMINLAPGDSLTATANGIQRTMTKDASIVGEIEYWTSYAFDDADTQFVVSFNRNNGVSAPNSNVKLPEGFTVLLPLSGTVFSRGQVIDVVWAPSGTAVVPSVSLTVDCVLTTGVFISETRNLSPAIDSGASSIAVSSVIPAGPIDTTQLCDATLYLSRQQFGNLDPNYGEGGRISAEHHKRATFLINPGL